MWIGLIMDASFFSLEKFDIGPESYLVHLDQFLETHNCSVDSIAEILVVTGPGSFTASRVSTTIANTISFAQNIPVYGIANTEELLPEELLRKGGLDKKTPFTFADPFYNRPPRTT